MLLVGNHEGLASGAEGEQTLKMLAGMREQLRALKARGTDVALRTAITRDHEQVPAYLTGSVRAHCSAAAS